MQYIFLQIIQFVKLKVNENLVKCNYDLNSVNLEEVNSPTH